MNSSGRTATGGALIHMQTVSIRRIALATAVAIPAYGLALVVLVLLPKPIALACAIAGMALLKVGHQFGAKCWTASGGVLMFAGVSAWAVRS